MLRIALQARAMSPRPCACWAAWPTAGKRSSNKPTAFVTSAAAVTMANIEATLPTTSRRIFPHHIR